MDITTSFIKTSFPYSRWYLHLPVLGLSQMSMKLNWSTLESKCPSGVMDGWLQTRNRVCLIRWTHHAIMPHLFHGPSWELPVRGERRNWSVAPWVLMPIVEISYDVTNISGSACISGKTHVFVSAGERYGEWRWYQDLIAFSKLSRFVFILTCIHYYNTSSNLHSNTLRYIHRHEYFSLKI